MWGDEYNPVYALVWLVLFCVGIRLVIWWFCKKLDREHEQRKRDNS